VAGRHVATPRKACSFSIACSWFAARKPGEDGLKNLKDLVLHPIRVPFPDSDAHDLV